MVYRLKVRGRPGSTGREGDQGVVQEVGGNVEDIRSRFTSLRADGLTGYQFASLPKSVCRCRLRGRTMKQNVRQHDDWAEMEGHRTP